MEDPVFYFKTLYDPLDPFGPQHWLQVSLKKQTYHPQQHNAGITLLPSTSPVQTGA